jgi:hypothetical protein
MGSDLRNEVLAIVLGGEGRPGYGHAVKLNRVDDHEARQALHIAVVRPRASAIEVGGDHPNALVGEVKSTGRGRSRGDASSGGGHGGDASKRRETADADDGGGQADRDEHHLHGAQPAQCKERTRKTEDQGEAAGERDGSSAQYPRKLAMFAREVNTPFRRCGDKLRAESARAFLGEHDFCLKLPCEQAGQTHPDRATRRRARRPAPGPLRRFAGEPPAPAGRVRLLLPDRERPRVHDAGGQAGRDPREHDRHREGLAGGGARPGALDVRAAERDPGDRGTDVPLRDAASRSTR